jgi:hypothetical protein
MKVFSRLIQLVPLSKIKQCTRVTWPHMRWLLCAPPDSPIYFPCMLQSLFGFISYALLLLYTYHMLCYCFIPRWLPSFMSMRMWYIVVDFELPVLGMQLLCFELHKEACVTWWWTDVLKHCSEVGWPFFSNKFLPVTFVDCFLVCPAIWVQNMEFWSLLVDFHWFQTAYSSPRVKLKNQSITENLWQVELSRRCRIPLCVSFQINWWRYWRMQLNGRAELQDDMSWSCHNWLLFWLWTLQVTHRELQKFCKIISSLCIHEHLFLSIVVKFIYHIHFSISHNSYFHSYSWMHSCLTIICHNLHAPREIFWVMLVSCSC